MSVTVEYGAPCWTAPRSVSGRTFSEANDLAEADGATWIRERCLGGSELYVRLEGEWVGLGWRPAVDLDASKRRRRRSKAASISQPRLLEEPRP